MKKILITGQGSYIGTSFENYMKKCSGYEVFTLDMIDGDWCEHDFSSYDAVFHVAGIAHRKETAENRDLYFEVNRDLAIRTAKKAKSNKVKQFVFLSSMSVYGLEEGVITKDTAPNPKSNYGKSKLQAEQELQLLKEEDFCVSIIRPPMVYGKDCKGNYQTVVKIVKKSPVFPCLKNKRSMIYIDNLCEFVKTVIDKKADGVYMPQNDEYIETTQMARGIAAKLNKKVFFSTLLGMGVVIIKPFIKKAKKAFGTLIYEDVEDFDYSYVVVSNEESYKRSV